MLVGVSVCERAASWMVVMVNAAVAVHVGMGVGMGTATARIVCVMSMRVMSMRVILAVLVVRKRAATFMVVMPVGCISCVIVRMSHLVLAMAGFRAAHSSIVHQRRVMG